MEASSCSPGHCGLCTEPVPEPTWGSQQRSFVAASQRSRHPEARPLGSGLQCKDLRQAREVAADGEQAQQEVVGPRGKSPIELPGLLPQWVLPGASESALTELNNKNFLSLFGGAVECARVFAAKGGCAAIVDICDDTRNDLSKFSAWNNIRKVAHLFHLIGIDLPCNTWTRARRAPPWSSLPGPLRGDHGDNVLGLPHLLPGDQLEVRKPQVA